MKIAVCVLVVVLVAIAGALLPSWWGWVSPRTYKKASSPDGSWSVTVFRQRNHPYPFTEGVDVTVVVTDRNGRILFRKTIDNCDLWEDVDAAYPDVICNNDEIRIGPDYWDGHESGYFKLSKQDVR